LRGRWGSTTKLRKKKSGGGYNIHKQAHDTGRELGMVSMHTGGQYEVGERVEWLGTRHKDTMG